MVSKSCMGTRGRRYAEGTLNTTFIAWDSTTIRAATTKQFARKPVMELQIVACFLRLRILWKREKNFGTQGSQTLSHGIPHPSPPPICRVEQWAERSMPYPFMYGIACFNQRFGVLNNLEKNTKPFSKQNSTSACPAKVLYRVVRKFKLSTGWNSRPLDWNLFPFDIKNEKQY